MTSNFWRHCAISALKILKKHFATFDFFVKMKLVSTVHKSTSLSKSGYSTSRSICVCVCTYVWTNNSDKRCMCYMKGSFFKNAGVLRVRYGHKVTFVLKRKKKMKCTRPKSLLKVPTTYHLQAIFQ